MPSEARPRRRKPAATEKTSRTNDGNRVVPGTVPRGSFQPSLPHEGGFSELGRFILDRFNRGVILLDAGGRVLDANAFALDLIEARDGLALVHGRLAFSDKAVNGRVAALLTTMSPPGEAPVMSVSAQIKRTGGRRPHRIAVYPVPVRDRGQAAFVVFVYPGHGAASISPEMLRELYSFTRAEAEVAAKLFAGQTVEQIAKSLHVSANTVRTHLKRIFGKCDVQSQAELVHVLALGPLAF